MKINCIVPSFNRPQQLDCLLQSLRLNAPNLDLDIRVLYKYSDEHFQKGYEICRQRFPRVFWHEEEDFNKQIRNFLMCGRHTLFFTDDCIFYRKFTGTNEDVLELMPGSLCFTWRVSKNTIVQNYLTGELQQPLELHGYEEIGDYLRWNYKIRPAHSNYGYWFSLDSHLYRSTDILTLLQGKTFDNPRSLETLIINNVKARMESPYKNMTAPKESCVFVNSVNRVQSGDVPAGIHHYYSPEELNFRYLNNEVVDFSATFNDIVVNSAHTELPLQFKQYEN